MLQACLNGGCDQAVVPGVPVTPAELAADAVAVRDAGAEALHLHPRDAVGAESLAPDDVGAATRAVRAAAPEAPVGVGTGAWIAPGGRARLEQIRGWEALPPEDRPDYASVNLHEEDAREAMAILDGLGVAIEAGLWTAAAARRLTTLQEAPRPLRVLVEMTSEDGAAAAREADAVLTILREGGVDAPILLHGEGGSAWPMLRMAGRLGHDARIGFEDSRRLPDGAPAASNRDLVAAAAAILAP